MRKALSLALALFAILSAFAQVNDQKIWSVNDDIYASIESLYLQQGMASPSSAGPWSTAELKMMFSRLADDGSVLYDYVSGRLMEPASKSVDNIFDFKFNWNSTLAAYCRSNTDFHLKYADEQRLRSGNDYTEDSNYIFRTHYSNRRPTFEFDVETWAGQSFYGYVSYQFQNENFVDDFDSHNLNFDIAWLTREGPTSRITQAPPFRAFIAVGGSYWSFQLGREQLSWGSGTSGNLVLSNNFPFHNVLRATAFGERFKYTFLMSFFPHPMNGNSGTYSLDSSSGGGQRGYYFYMAHRLESRFLNDRLSAALTESIVYQSEYSIDPRFIIPSAVFHNYFIKYNANSIVGIEANYTMNRFLSLYGQIVVDDVSSPIEASEGDSIPTALGFTLGLKSSIGTKEGVLDLSLEGVYTMPYLYHRSLSGNEQGATEYGLNYIGIYRSLDSGPAPRYYIGYTYGGDAMVLDFKGSYRRIAQYSIGTEVFAMVHGSKWIDSLFRLEPELRTPSGSPIFTGYVKLSGSCFITPFAKAFADLYFVKNNGQKDFQCTIGINLN